MGFGFSARNAAIIYFGGLGIRVTFGLGLMLQFFAASSHAAIIYGKPFSHLIHIY